MKMNQHLPEYSGRYSGLSSTAYYIPALLPCRDPPLRGREFLKTEHPCYSMPFSLTSIFLMILPSYRSFFKIRWTSLSNCWVHNSPPEWSFLFFLTFPMLCSQSLSYISSHSLTLFRSTLYFLAVTEMLCMPVVLSHSTTSSLNSVV